jgi:hypothetical protein
MPYRAPDEAERRAFFHHLKMASSLTGWQRALVYYGDLLAIVRRAYEDTWRNDPEPTIPKNEMALLAFCHSCFALGVQWLSRGDRNCFKFLGRKGHFSEAHRMIEVWRDAEWRYAASISNEFILGCRQWPEIKSSLHKFLRVRGENSEVLQARYSDVPAPIESPKEIHHPENLITGPRLRELLTRTDLAPVPTPPKEVLVPTGGLIPCFGIWEPVKVDWSAGVAGMFKKPLAPADGAYVLDGCPNYLHEGGRAPTIAFPEDTPRREGRPTVWRLLWEDRRYLDGVVPEEERDYVFKQPLEA